MSTVRRSGKQRVSTAQKTPQTLGDYIEAKIKERGTTRHAVAVAMGVSHSYLSDIAHGKFVPSVKICKTIADFFGDPPSYILRLAGWLTIDATDAIAIELAEALANDPLLREMYEVYSKLRTAEERKAMAKAIRIFAGAEGEK